MGNGDPPLRAAVLQPFFIAAFRPEHVAVAFNGYPSLSKNARKLLPEVSVREEDPAHAARE